MIPNPLSLGELTFILVLSLPIIIWGFQHGLDAVIIAVIGVLAGMAFSDTLAGGTVSFLNTSWRLGKAILATGAFGPEAIVRFREEPGLIETPDQIKLFGTIVFLAITYVAFKIAFRRAGGRSNAFEGIFGALGAAVTGYLIITFLITRHVRLPQVVQIDETTELPGFVAAPGQPSITLDANVLVLLALVIIVFGVQISKRKK
ncbi:MAG: hypothetical protein ACRDGG_07195 [Anaerolineae bacterium]